MENLSIALFQNDIFWKEKQKNFDNIERQFASLNQRVHIAVLPETFNTGFTVQNMDLAETMFEESLIQMCNWGLKYKCIVVGSLFIKEKGKLKNRLCWVFPDGNIIFYDKRHLFSLANENTSFSKGNKRLITSVNGWKINSIICYDLRFPVWIRNEKNIEYDLLICVANWPKNRITHWEKLLTARAIENQCFVVGVNRVGKDPNVEYNGNSLIFNAWGDVLYRGSTQQETFIYTFNKQELLDLRKKFPFGKNADKFSFI